MFLDYSELLNSLDSGISAKITINNRRINKEEFEKSILLPMKEDGLDHYRKNTTKCSCLRLQEQTTVSIRNGI